MLCAFNGTALRSVLPPLLVTEFIMGALGNGLALWILSFHLKPWKSSTVLLFNLAMADFLLIMVLPFRANYYISNLEWKFGSTFCNTCLFMLAMNRSGSTLFLMAIALDRYMRVVHPHHSINFLSISKAACGAAVLWMLAFSMSAQVFTLNHINTTFCRSLGVLDTEHPTKMIWHTFTFLFSFYVPLGVILYCTVSIISHLRGRQIAQQLKMKRALFFIILVVVFFIICFLPSNITQIMIWLKANKANQTWPQTGVCTAIEELDTVFNITISLTYLNSVLDPVVYYFSSPTIRNICRRALGLPQASETAESTDKRTRESSQSLSQL